MSFNAISAVASAAFFSDAFNVAAYSTEAQGWCNAPLFGLPCSAAGFSQLVMCACGVPRALTCSKLVGNQFLSPPSHTAVQATIGDSSIFM